MKNNNYDDGIMKNYQKSEVFNKMNKEITKLKTIINSSTNGVIIIDTLGNISCVNKAALKILNNQKKEILGKSIRAIFVKFKDERDILDKFKRINKENIIYENKKLVYDFIPLEIDNKLSGATIILQDISIFENVLKELKLNKELSKRLDRIIEYSYDGIYITDGNANTLRINKAYERITGLKREGMLGRNMRELVRDGYISQSGSLKVLEKRKTISINQEFKTGQKALITSKPVFDKDNNIILIITNVRDVTELYNLKRELEANEKLTQKYYSQIKELKNQILDISDFIVEDKNMLNVLYTAKKVAITDIPVLLLGESGVGKEVLAKFIHKNSNRSEKTFIKINCGAIPENLIESELFGYEKGAFTGANKDGKIGLFELAHRGSLFLDEIGELPLRMQVKLLRALQEGEIKKVGGSKVIHVDVRVISATNKNLERMVDEKIFREDLFYRLNVIPINIPPLRERKQDIMALIKYFLNNINEKYGWNKFLERDVIDVFYDYNWPGNVRELRNIVERIVVMSNKDVITCDHLPRKILSSKKNDFLKLNKEIIPLKNAIGIVEKELLKKAYDKYGNVRDAAKALEIDPSTFVRKRKKYDDRLL